MLEFQLSLHQTFNTFEELQNFLKNYQIVNSARLYTRNSRKLTRNKSLKRENAKKELIYYSLEYACAKGGKKFFSRSTGLRNSSSIKENCPMRMCFNLTPDGQQFILTKYIEEHNHEIDKSIFEKKTKGQKTKNNEIEEKKSLKKGKALKKNRSSIKKEDTSDEDSDYFGNHDEDYMPDDDGLVVETKPLIENDVLYYNEDEEIEDEGPDFIFIKNCHSSPKNCFIVGPVLKKRRKKRPKRTKNEKTEENDDSIDLGEGPSHCNDDDYDDDDATDHLANYQPPSKKAKQMDRSEINATIKAGKTYLGRLQNLDEELNNAIQQINGTFEETEKIIVETILNLKNAILDTLNARQAILVEKAKQIKNESVYPLNECRNVILEKIESTNKLLQIGVELNSDVTYNLPEFVENASMLGSLPEVPALKEVPFISFQYDSSLETQFQQTFSEFGDISRIAPVQISSMTEKPGAILVEWQSVNDDEKSVDIQGYKLQRAFGDVNAQKHWVANFKDCYEGMDSQYLVKDVYPNQNYSFRVCCKFEGCTEWSPWSLHQVSRTSLQPFSWKTNGNYLMTNSNRVATPLSANPLRPLLSNGPQFGVGNSIEFTILDVCEKGKMCVGLTNGVRMEWLKRIVAEDEQCFYVDSDGKIFVNGQQKSTVLQKFKRNLKVSFTCEEVNENKVRVNIDSSDKRVTYDWSIPASSKLYFGAQFANNVWKIMVE